jgi:hypothetical protein
VMSTYANVAAREYRRALALSGACGCGCVWAIKSSLPLNDTGFEVNYNVST